MSASNQAFLACSLREPRDPESEKLLDDFDEQRMTQERTFLPMFGGSGDELPAADVAGGIFEGQPMED